METIDEILNGSEETPAGSTTEQQQVDDGEGQGTGYGGQSTGEDGAQVAAEDNTQPDNVQQPDVKSELSALSKERERVRQKEVALDAELAKLKEQQQSGDQQQQTDDQASTQPTTAASIKELRKLHREALEQSIVDPTDEEAAQRVEELEDQLEEARINQIKQHLKSDSVQEKAAADFDEVYADLHEKYPFLTPGHPQVDAQLNSDINAFYEGLLKRGESRAEAVRKAVETFAPAQAVKLGIQPKPATQRQQKNQEQTTEGAGKKPVKGGFSEVHSAGNSGRTSKPFTGPTPMEDILGSSSTR